jgi:hypothetical protein
MRKIVLILVVLAAGVQCGYRLAGRGSAWPQSYRKIFIATFENRTSRSEVDQFFTAAFKKEFTRRGRLELVSEASQADLVLEGVILALEIHPLSYDSKADASSYLAKLHISVNLFAPRNGTVYYSSDDISKEEQLDIDQEDFNSQEQEALLKLAEKFASSVAVMIFENF